MAQKQESDIFTSLSFILLPALVLGMVWFGSKDHIVRFLMWSSPPVYEAAALYIPSPLIPDGMRAKMARLSVELPTLNWKDVAKKSPWKASTSMLELHGYIFRLVLIPLFIYFAIRWFFEAPSRLIYKRQLSFIQLAKENADKFPWVLPALNAAPHLRDPFTGTWKMPLTDFQFCMCNGLLIYKKDSPNELKIPPQDHNFVRKTVPEVREMHAKKLIGVPEIAKAKNIDISGLESFFSSHRFFSLDTEKTDELLRKQLGKPWRGVDALPPLERALAICFMGAACGGALNKEAHRLLNQISATFVQAAEDKNGNIVGKSSANLLGINDLKDKVINNPIIKKICASHAFESTVLMRLLDRRLKVGARSKGKLPPKRFLWLKPHNEPLWRVLHKVGAQKPWAEGISAFHHYENEIRIGVPIRTPIIEGATYALVKSLYEQQWIYDSDLASEEEAEALQLLKMLQAADEADKKTGKPGPGQMTRKG